MRVLLAEDDTLLGDGIRASLEHEGYQVIWVRDGEAAEQQLQEEASCDILILDLGLPKRPGLSVLRQLRTRGSQMPVLILTARDSVTDRVAGLDAGADDYLTKPFDLDELFARLRALARRCNCEDEGRLRNGDVVLDRKAHTVTLAGKPVDLPPREFVLLEYLLENKGRVLSRSQLEEAVYSWSSEIESNAIEVHIHHLRRKLGAAFIRTIRGVGYKVDKLSSG